MYEIAFWQWKLMRAYNMNYTIQPLRKVLVQLFINIVVIYSVQGIYIFFHLIEQRVYLIL